MSKFNFMVYENAKKLRLKRVMIKCDPKLSGSLDFSSVTAYEGYILEESGDSISVVVIKQGLPVISMSPSLTTPTVEPQLNPNRINHFKHYITKMFQSGDPLIDQINKINSVEEIEALLIQNNLTPEKFVDILRKYISGKLISEQAPSFLSNAGQFAAGAAKGIASGLANMGDAAQSISNLSSQLKQGQYGKIASAVAQKWDEAKQQQLDKLMFKATWPTGLPKTGSYIKIIYTEMPTINKKTIVVNKVQKIGNNIVFFGDILAVSRTAISVIITASEEPNTGGNIKEYVNVKYMEGGVMSPTLNKDIKDGDSYILQYSSVNRGYELVQSKSTESQEVTVKCARTNKINDIGDFVCVSRFGTPMWGRQARYRLITAPILRPDEGVYFARAVLA